eukprot:5050922-Amphidinium_carterae.2
MWEVGPTGRATSNVPACHMGLPHNVSPLTLAGPATPAGVQMWSLQLLALRRRPLGPRAFSRLA